MSSIPRIPGIELDIAGTVTASNGTVIKVENQYVTFRLKGPRGGYGEPISIPMAEWDTINRLVVAVRDAITTTKISVQNTANQISEEQGRNALSVMPEVR